MNEIFLLEHAAELQELKMSGNAQFIQLATGLLDDSDSNNVKAERAIMNLPALKSGGIVLTGPRN